MNLESFTESARVQTALKPLVSSALHHEMEGGGCECTVFLRAVPFRTYIFDEEGAAPDTRYNIVPVQFGHHLYMPAMSINERKFPFGNSLNEVDAWHVLCDFNAAIASMERSVRYGLRSEIILPDDEIRRGARHVNGKKHRGITHIDDSLNVTFSPVGGGRLSPFVYAARKRGGPDANP